MLRVVHRNSGRPVAAGEWLSDLDGGLWQYGGLVPATGSEPLRVKVVRRCAHSGCPAVPVGCPDAQVRVFAPLALNLSIG